MSSARGCSPGRNRTRFHDNGLVAHRKTQPGSLLFSWVESQPLLTMLRKTRLISRGKALIYPIDES